MTEAVTKNMNTEHISMTVKNKLVETIVFIITMEMCGCETWKLRKKINAFENKCTWTARTNHYWTTHTKA